MRLGIIGFPQSGKTTLYNALTRGTQPISGTTGKIEVHTAVVEVPDDRVNRLSQMFNPKKTTYARVTYTDISGLDGNSAKSGIGGSLLNHLSQMDGFIHVVRCFENDNVPHIYTTVDHQRDIATMDSEFILNDLVVIERRLERLQDERRKGGSRDHNIIDLETVLLEHLQSALSEETPLRDLPLTHDEDKSISGYGFLSRKPILIVMNLGEGQDEPDFQYDHLHSRVVALQGQLEMEIAQLPVDEMQIFLDEYKITEPSLNRMIRVSYDLLGLHSFFTYGPDEVRAWTVRCGATAPEAAGVIHSDLQKGFIRAETMAYNDLTQFGSVAEVKTHGKMRLEGKNYIIQDGDLLTIRFNVK
jgi:ribosome-binding ATPase